MPHIIFAGEAPLKEIFEKFAPQRGDSNGWIIKIKNCLLSMDGTMLMFDCTAVRSGFSQDFYIRAEAKSGRLTVRVDPYMRIERNEGVQRTIVAVSRIIRGGAGTGLSFDKSNLPAEVLEELEQAGTD